MLTKSLKKTLKDAFYTKEFRMTSFYEQNFTSYSINTCLGACKGKARVLLGKILHFLINKRNNIIKIS